MSISGILYSWCFVPNTLPAAIVFGLPIFACIYPAIDCQANAVCFDDHVLLGTSLSVPYT